jgi:pimeloyl-ACP methyl ester carboxylesterase
MSYEQSRDAAQMSRLGNEIGSFIQRWNARGAVSRRRVLFLFPGGMGSALYRARKPYRENGPPLQHFRYDKVWLDIGTFLGDALDLKMQHTTAGWRDKNNHIIIADGTVELACISPYDDFIEWCDLNNIDWFIFGYDWRRPAGDAASFFLTKFLPVFRQRVIEAVGLDPLANYFVVGHSMGGMVANEIARRPNLPAMPARVITVAGLFYGYSGQLHRWFERDSYFALIPEMAYIRTVTSLPGPYEFPLLDPVTFARYRPLAAYPCVDAADALTKVDPYAPGPQRYPDNTGFDTGALAKGHDTMVRLTAPMPPGAPPFVAIRGITTKRNGTDDLATPGGVRWKKLVGAFDPSKPSPIIDDPAVAGDGTLPAWSTRLVGARHRDVRGTDIDHMFMMENPAVLAALATYL